MITIAAGVVLGAAGSVHCGAMCGPLALLVDGAGDATDRRGRWGRRVAYHGGRLATYAVLGATAGLAGDTLRHAGVGRGVALVAGLALIGQGCLRLRARGATGVPTGRLTRALGVVAAARRRAIARPAVLGALNGLLPCGLIYAAVAAAAGSASVAGGLGVMIGFGLGTTPALLGVSMLAGAGSWPGLRRVAAPVALAVAGLILVVRALAPAIHDHGVTRTVPAAAAAAAPSQAPGHRHP